MNVLDTNRYILSLPKRDDEKDAAQKEQLADKEFKDNWVIRVYNVTDLNQIMTQLIEGDSFELNTSLWKPGVYIIRAYFGDKLYTAKITVK